MRASTALIAAFLLLATAIASGGERPRVFLIDVRADRASSPDEPELTERVIRVVTGRHDAFEWTGVMKNVSVQARLGIELRKTPGFVHLSLLNDRKASRISPPREVEFRAFLGQKVTMTLGEGGDDWSYSLQPREVSLSHWKSPEYATSCGSLKVSPAEAIERMIDYQEARKPPTRRYDPNVINHYLLVGDQYLFSKSDVSKQWNGIALRGYCIDGNTGALTVVRDGSWLTDKQQKSLWSSVEREHYAPYLEALAKRSRESQ
jgi:hypothetical protein